MRRNSFLYALTFSVICYACGSKERNVTSEQQVFRYNESKGISTLDPAFARNLALIWPVTQLFNGLVQLSDSLAVEPCVAKQWHVSDDGLQYTFLLRDDVYFHDSEVFPNGLGRRVTASDFVYSFSRLLNPKLASPGSWVLSMLDRNFAGFTNGCKALNDTILIIRLSKPFPAFLGLVSMPYCFVVPHEAIEHYGGEFGRRPVGTGPFYMKYWRDGEKLVLRRNAHYFELDNEGKRLPYLESVVVTFVVDKQSEFIEFISGNIDMLSGVHASSKDELLTRTGNLNPKYREKVLMLTGPYLNTEYLGVLLDSIGLESLENSALHDLRVRKALGYGFDRNAMMLYLRGNLGFPATRGIVPPAMPGFETSTEGFYYNPDKSRQLLVEAGYPNGNGLPPITISTTDDYLDVCEFIQHQLGEVGFDIRIDVLPGAAYRDMMANSKLSLFRASWVADYADPENYLALFVSSNFSPLGPNYTHFSSSEYDQLYRKALAEPLYDNRLPYYRAMDSLVIANAAVIPLYYDKVVRFISKDVEGITLNPMNLLELKRVRKSYSGLAPS